MDIGPLEFVVIGTQEEHLSQELVAELDASIVRYSPLLGPGKPGPSYLRMRYCHEHLFSIVISSPPRITLLPLPV